jgi:hypothetical protein
MRNAHEALADSEQGILYSQKKAIEIYEIMFLGFKSEAQQIDRKMDEAGASLARANELYKNQSSMVISVFLAPYISARFMFRIEELNQATHSKASPDLSLIQKQAYSAGKEALKVMRKYAPYRTKIYRLMGIYKWLIGKQGKAITWWRRSIKEGKRLGAYPDLSRTYFEVGKRLLEPNSQYNQLDGINAKGYFEKAKVMFEDMNLQWDLEELEKVAQDIETQSTLTILEKANY